MKETIKPETIRNNIRKLLELKKWTQADLERKIGNTRSVNNILRGNSKYPTIEVLQRIANAFNVEINRLLYDYNEDYEPINHQLLLECFVKVTNASILIEETYKITPENLLYLTAEAYNNLRKLKIDSPDEKFIDWIISKYYS